jgi:hypothetical protein
VNQVGPVPAGDSAVGQNQHDENHNVQNDITRTFSGILRKLGGSRMTAMAGRMDQRILIGATANRVFNSRDEMRIRADDFDKQSL